MDVHHIVAADIALDLADRFKKRQRFDVTDGSADFSDYDISVRFFSGAEYTVFNFICDMRYYLYGSA